MPEGGNLEEVDFTGINIRLKQSIDFAGKIEELTRDGEARAIWRRVYHDLSEGRPGLFGAVISRADAQVVRLSAIYALLDCSSTIKAVHQKGALAVWKYCEQSAHFLFGDAVGDPTADDILSQLRVHPEGMTRTEIREYFSRNKSSAEISRSLGVLQEYGLARVERIPNSDGVGRPKRPMSYRVNGVHNYRV